MVHPSFLAARHLSVEFRDPCVRDQKGPKERYGANGGALNWGLAALFFVLIACVSGSMAQSPGKTEACGCNAVTGNQRHFYDSKNALTAIDSFRKLFRSPPVITLLPFACAGDLISAGMCQIEITERLSNGLVQKRQEDRRYIFYNTDFMDRVAKRNQSGSEAFLIAHEIAHHMLGHTYFKYTVRDKTALGLTETPYQNNDTKEPKPASAKQRNKKKPGVVRESPRGKVQELEADILALWMVSRIRGLMDTDRLFDDLIAAYNESSPTTIDEHNENSYDHPSFFMRKQMAKGIGSRLRGNLLTSVTIDSTVRIGFERDVLSFYDYLIVTADEEASRAFSKEERLEWEEANRKRGVYLEVVGGMQVQQQHFRREGKPVPTTTGLGGSAGLRIGMGKWYRSHHVETDFRLNYHQFGTLTEAGGPVQKVEDFQITQLQIQPRYVFSRLKRKHRYQSSSSGFLASAGFSGQFPLSLHYTNANFSSGIPEKPQLTPSVAPVLGLGWGSSKWFSTRGHFRVWLNYSPQPVRYRERAAQQVRAFQHTFTLDLAYRLW
ncbi:hypothetical protein LZD49_31220 [Dyadobacter sp. CY261]|uniref:hypothetical protein n=1 Tax=Dyadobacter sp. CY261 TaxID=2907203 RepID=UPI001F2DF15B|nr:hypothetical protein [Dyadobacter sp. CY261]MCF0074997.1 hypothetical protein [Dyadobacter sp. CY261]